MFGHIVSTLIFLVQAAVQLARNDLK